MAEVNETPKPTELSKDARLWAMICHLAGLAGMVIPVVGNIVGPLIVWQIKKDMDPFVDRNGKEALNFQISMLIYGIVAGLLCTIFIGCFLLPLVGIADLVLLIIDSIKASNGEAYRYPVTIRLIK